MLGVPGDAQAGVGGCSPLVVPVRRRMLSPARRVLMVELGMLQPVGVPGERCGAEPAPLTTGCAEAPTPKYFCSSGEVCALKQGEGTERPRRLEWKS